MLSDLHAEITHAGYYPDLAQRALADALGDDLVQAHYVHVEATFDAGEVRRHLTVLVLTSARLIRLHIDDGTSHHLLPGEVGTHEALSSIEHIFLRTIHGVALSYVVNDPEQAHAAAQPQELILAVSWGTQARLELEPAICGDESCTNDHGYAGIIGGAEPVLRVSRIADGPEALNKLTQFVQKLNHQIGQL